MAKGSIESTIVITVKRDKSLPKITKKEFRSSSRSVLQKARQGKQVAVVDDNGRVKEVIGINGRRLLPEPSSDLFEKIAEINEDELTNSTTKLKW